MRIVAIIQARMGSSRLPCKMMLQLHGFAVIDWVLHRALKSALLDQCVVATSENPLDDPLAAHLERTGAHCFRGPEDDVLRRFRLAAERTEATHVVRICADNPLLWGGEIDNLIMHYRTLAGQYDPDRIYAYNHIPRNNRYPDGLGAEIVSAPLLRFLDERATLPAHREHCLSYIWDNPEAFHRSTFDPPDARLHHPELKLDLDSAEDYRKLALLPLHRDITPEELVRVASEERGKR